MARHRRHGMVRCGACAAPCVAAVRMEISSLKVATPALYRDVPAVPCGAVPCPAAPGPE